MAEGKIIPGNCGYALLCPENSPEITVIPERWPDTARYRQLWHAADINGPKIGTQNSGYKIIEI